MAKIGRLISGIEVMSPQIIKKNPADYYIIIAASLLHSPWMKKQLLNYGVCGEDIAFYFPCLTIDFELFNNKIFVDTAIDAFTDVYKHVPLIKIDIGRLIIWIRFESSKNLMKWILCDFDGKKRLRMLDIGPGMGIQSITMKKMLDVDITWIDVIESRGLPAEHAGDNISFLKERFNIHIEEGNIETIQCDFTDKFDIILFSCVLEHFHYHPVKTMEKILSWLKPDGRLYLAVPDNKIRKGPRYYDTWREMPIYDPEHPITITDYDHQLEYYYEEALDLFKELNLKVERFARSWNGVDMGFTLTRL
jgi:SAM-dependent methyltransferase